jgi:hypothetical protein
MHARRRRLTTAASALSILAALSMSTMPAQAAFGDKLAEFDAAATAGVPGCGVGTGIAFDGDWLYLSCWGNATLYKVDPATHLGGGSVTLAGVSDIGAMAYDGTRDRLWVCSSGSTVKAFVLATGAADPSLAPFAVSGCVDGLAYDGEDDTIWASPDAHSITSHYQLDGSPIATFFNTSRLGGVGNSGIAVGGEDIYLANNGGSQIYSVEKDFSSSTLLATFPRRIEDLECDELTFAPKAAIWAQDAYDRILSAYEIPAGSCDHGGVASACEVLSVTITRPTSGRTYENDVDLGPSGGTDPIVIGSPLTLEATTSDPPNTGRVDFYVDSVLVGTDTTSPYSVVASGPFTLGAHGVKARVTHATNPLCRNQDARAFTVECALVGLAIDRPDPGRLYFGDADVGAAPGVATVLSGDLTAEASLAKPELVASVTFEIPGVAAPVVDALAPYSGVLDLSSATPGTLASVTVTATYFAPGCSKTLEVPIRFAAPDGAALARGVHVTSNVPVEPIVTIGGVAARNSTDDVVFFERTNTGPIDRVAVVEDHAASSLEPLTSTATSKVEHLSLNGGLVTIESLYARASVSRSGALGTTSSFAGSYVARLVVNGTPIVVDTPNTEIPLAGLGKLILLETVELEDAGRRELTVNAVHLFLDTPFKSEIVLGSAHAAINLYEPNFAGPASDLIHDADDAATNTDAGNDAASAIDIGEGVYTGLLQNPDVADAFTFQAGQGDRIVATVRGSERVTVAPPTPTSVYQTEVSLELIDPDGNVRESSALGPDLPQRVELNADTPYAPAGAKGDWTLIVRNLGGDTFYTLSLSLPPNPLLEQEDARIPGDAGDTCDTARALPNALQPNELDEQVIPGVIRDLDQADHFSFDATIGQIITITLKPDTLIDGADLDLELRGPSIPGGDTDCTDRIAVSVLGKDPLPKASPDAVIALPVEVSGRYTFGVLRYNAVANYVVEVSVVNPNPTQPGNDARTGTDASDDCSGATPISSGTTQGRLTDIPDDLEDWYSFDVAAGNDVTISVLPTAGSVFEVHVLNGCVRLDPGITPAFTALEPTTWHARNLPAGTYKISIEIGASGGGNYQLTLAVTP